MKLSEKVAISEIRIFGGNILYNAIPGNLYQATVGIGGCSAVLETEPFINNHNDRILITGTSLDGIVSDTIILSNLHSQAYPPDSPNLKAFSITEIEINGTSVPEPATMLLLGSGLLAFIGLRRRFTK